MPATMGVPIPSFAWLVVQINQKDTVDLCRIELVPSFVVLGASRAHKSRPWVHQALGKESILMFLLSFDWPAKHLFQAERYLAPQSWQRPSLRV